MSSFTPEPLPLPGPFEPVNELIAENLLQAMRDITQSNGFWFNIKDVRRWVTGPFNASDLPAIAIYELDESSLINQYNVEERMMAIVAEAWLQPTQNGAMGRDMMRMRSDVYRAATRDPTRGDHAVDTTLARVLPFIADIDQSICGVQLYFDVHYRHHWGKPWEFIGDNP